MVTNAPSSAQTDIFTAIKAAADHATEGWTEAAHRIVERLCREHSQFTADDVLDELEKTTFWKTRDNRALGSVMIEAVGEGLCENTGFFVRSRRPERHKRPVTLWKSLLYSPSQSSDDRPM